MLLVCVASAIAPLRRNLNGEEPLPCAGKLFGPSVIDVQDNTMTPIESPCILICSMDLTTGYCFGCGRTREEIGGWTSMTPKERRDTMELLPARLETMERRPRRETKRSRMARERGLTEG
jgi:uncharacterized protein